jgi:hypothetical protein
MMFQQTAAGIISMHPQHHAPLFWCYSQAKHQPWAQPTAFGQADRRPVEPGQFAPALTILTPTISNPLAPFGPESDHPVDTARVAQGQLGMLVQHCRFGQPFAPPPSHRSEYRSLAVIRNAQIV